jgi:tRNA pseudouridine38-40 synthase
MRNIALVVSYDGTSYHGWQCQPDLTTIQEVLTERIEKILDHKIKLFAGARTDSGVHAYGQVVNFRSDKGIDLRSLIRGVNSLLPLDVRVRDAREVDDAFHARYSAKSKVYIYSILNATYNSPFYGRYVWHIPYPIDVFAMNETIRLIRGSHDFSSFRKKDEVYKSSVREVLKTGVRRKGEFIYILVEATGFLRYMIRNIVGTLMLVGSGRLSKEDFQMILESKDRQKAGPTAPPQGLFLRVIKY